MFDAFQQVLNRGLATMYGMKPGEIALDADGHCAWDDSWDVYRRFVIDAPKSARDARKDAVEAAWGPFHRAQKGEAPAGGLGNRRIVRRSVAHKYVIFSDHHITFPGHRHYGTWGANLDLYCTALQAYFAGGYVLVENGDVEELVIYEPDVRYDHPRPEPEVRAALTRMRDLNNRRRKARKLQLRWILGDAAHAPLLQRWREFANARLPGTQRSRLIRVAGNHDYDLQTSSGYLDLYHAAGVPLDKPADYLVIGPKQDRPFVVMHGHQFDKASNPTSGRRFGETISECLGVYYQGADRTWPAADTRKWREGTQRFLNDLVSDDPGGWLGNLDAALFEALFHHNIAWDYFDNYGDPARAMEEEVLAGKRWIKFRHMDERAIWRHLNNYPKPERPKLVLGHSHEVRAHPRAPTEGQLVDCYFNSGSAGRFEKLVWGLEIVGGTAVVVSWAERDDGTIERREWTPDKEHYPGFAAKRGVLKPGATSGSSVP